MFGSKIDRPRSKLIINCAEEHKGCKLLVGFKSLLTQRENKIRSSMVSCHLVYAGVIFLCFVNAVFSCAASAKKEGTKSTPRPMESITEGKETSTVDPRSKNAPRIRVSNCTLKLLAQTGKGSKGMQHKRGKSRKHRKMRRKRRCHKGKAAKKIPHRKNLENSKNAQVSMNRKTGKRIRSGMPSQSGGKSLTLPQVVTSPTVFANNSITNKTTASVRSTAIPTASTATSITAGKIHSKKGSRKTPTYSLPLPTTIAVGRATRSGPTLKSSIHSSLKRQTSSLKGPSVSTKTPLSTKIFMRTTTETIGMGVAQNATGQTLSTTRYPVYRPSDPCTAWERCSLHRDKKILRWLSLLPACPCFFSRSLYYNSSLYDQLHGRFFHWRVLNNDYERLFVYKATAAYCIRQYLTGAEKTIAAQQCCYDSVSRLITRGSGAGTPNLVAPELDQTMHVVLDVKPYHVCQGDWTRYHVHRPPNNALNCKTNPSHREFRQQIRQAREF